jgi:hypothetical protein
MHHLETPRSYLTRLCEVNVVDVELVHSIIRRRRVITGRADEVGRAIAELGGPPVRSFARSYLTATRARPQDVTALLRATFRNQHNYRTVCERCTSGAHAATYDHYGFAACLRHRRWTFPGPAGASAQAQLPGVQWVAAERRFRRIASSAFLTRELLDTAWTGVRDQAIHAGPGTWRERLDAARQVPGHVDGAHDRMALFPETVRILDLLAQARTWYYIDTYSRTPERLRAHFRTELSWIDDGPLWVLIGALVDQTLRTRRKDVNALLSLLVDHARPLRDNYDIRVYRPPVR